MWRIETNPTGRPDSSEVSSRSSSAMEFDRLALPLFHSLYNFAYWLVRNQHDAEDLVQEAYLRALKHFDSFEPGTNFKAWIFKILKNISASSFSKLKSERRVELELDEIVPSQWEGSINPECLVISSARMEELRQAIEDLPTHFREVILLRETEEVSYQQIAEILSIPIGTVMSRLSRARMMIRRSCEESRRESIDDFRSDRESCFERNRCL